MLEVVITCVDYSDYLRVTLPYTMNFADRIVVVTTNFDKKTQELCKSFDVPCLESNAFFYNGPFNKGRAINEGLSVCSRRDWVLHMDADIAILDPMVDTEKLDQTKLYGLHRFNIVGPERWEVYTDMKPSFRKRVSKDFMPSHKSRQGGPVIIGFFQLWYYRNLRVGYPDKYPDASQSDMVFSDYWAADKREVLKQPIAYHLSMPYDRKGQNWRGRVTKEFVV